MPKKPTETPATLDDAEAKPWPFPKGKDGESGPDVNAPAEAPAMTKAEAYLTRKPGRFELPEQIEVKLKSWTPRTEKHGDDDVSASSMGLKLIGANTLLDSLLPSLRRALYAAADGAQEALPGVEEATPLLRTKGIEQVKLTPAFEGWTLRIYHGIDEEEPFVIGGCKVDQFSLVPHDGGSIELDFRVGSSDIDEHEAGWLYGNQKREIVITLHAPEVKPDAIDGTVGHPGLVEPGPTDLFVEQHGRSDDGEQQEPAEEAS